MPQKSVLRFLSAESSGLWLRAVPDGSSAPAPGGTSTPGGDTEPACCAADCAVQDAPRYLPLPFQLCLWQDAKD